MPKPLPERKIAITVNYRGWITLLNVMGPVVHPITVTEKKALQLVMSGAEVVEHIKGGQTIKLTLDNVRDPRRYASLEAKPIAVDKKPGVPINKANQLPKASVPTTPPNVEKDPEPDPAPVVVPPAKVKEPEPEPVQEEPVVVEESAPAVPVAEPEPPAEEPVGPLAKDYEFSYNKNGSVDETKIPWQDFSKNQRRLLRERINHINARSNMPKI